MANAPRYRLKTVVLRASVILCVRAGVSRLAQHVGCRACSSLPLCHKDEHAWQPACWASPYTDTRTDVAQPLPRMLVLAGQGSDSVTDQDRLHARAGQHLFVRVCMGSICSCVCVWAAMHGASELHTDMISMITLIISRNDSTESLCCNFC